MPMVRKITLPFLFIMIFSAFSTQLLIGQSGHMDARLLEERSNYTITSDRILIEEDNIVRSNEMPATEAVTSFNIDYDLLSLNDDGFIWFMKRTSHQVEP